MSSANARIKQIFEISIKSSLIARLKRIGESTDPCLTPLSSLTNYFVDMSFHSKVVVFPFIKYSMMRIDCSSKVVLSTHKVVEEQGKVELCHMLSRNQ
jgi:hypothetical protein